METETGINPVQKAINVRRMIRFFLIVNLLGSIPALALWNSADWTPWLFGFLGLVAWGFFTYLILGSRNIPYVSSLKEVQKLKTEIFYMHSQVNKRQAAWLDELGYAEFKVQVLQNGWGLPLMNCPPDGQLCELFIFTADPAPRGYIRGATATFADNTSEQIVPVGSIGATSYQHGSNIPGNRDYNRLSTSTTTTVNVLQNFKTGSASVQISGPDLAPGVILFPDARQAQVFTNIFNGAARDVDTANAHLQSNLAKALKELAEIKEKETQDFGMEAISARLSSEPSEVVAWIGAPNSRDMFKAEFEKAAGNSLCVRQQHAFVHLIVAVVNQKLLHSVRTLTVSRHGDGADHAVLFHPRPQIGRKITHVKNLVFSAPV